MLIRSAAEGAFTRPRLQFNHEGLMPFGIHDDFLLNPHFLSGGVATALPVGYRFDRTDYTAPEQQGRDQFVGHTGMFISAPILQVGQFHRFRVKSDTDPKRAALNFTSEATTLIGCINPPFYPERPFNQGNVGRIFVYAGSMANPPGPACFGGPIDRPVRGAPTSYGWLIEVDSGGTGNFDMTVFFFHGP